MVRINIQKVLVGGMIAGLSLLSALLLYGLSTTYRKIDPIEGIPR